MIKDTIIFDLDGTLLDTLEDLYLGFNYSIMQYGYPARTIDEIRNFVGNGIKKAIERALPENVSCEELNNIIEIFKNYYKNHMLEHTKPYNGIIELLQILKQNGYKLAVVSNKFDDAVKELNEIYFGQYINVAIGEGYGIKKKPEPAGVYKALIELNSSIEKTIYVGDSDVDIQTAKNANIPCISVLWGFKDKDYLTKNGGKYFAVVPSDIIKIIEKNFYLI